MGRRAPADELIWRIIAAVLSGTAGALGIGGGGILIIYLSLFEKCDQIQAQGINLLFFLPCGIVAVIIHAFKRRIDFKSAGWMILGGVPGAAAGFFLAGYIGSAWLGKIFAVLLIFLGIRSLFTKEKPKA